MKLSLLLEETGLKRDAKWLIAEGAEACKVYRSLPVGKAIQDVLVAYGQNGEGLRPEPGFPLRLVAPVWEGNISVRWLHLVRQPDGGGTFIGVGRQHLGVVAREIRPWG